MPELDKLKRADPPKIERRTYIIEDLEIETRAESEPEHILGHAAVFDKWTDLGFIKERVAPGAFSTSIQEDDIRALINHDPNLVLGRNRAGTLSLAEDEKGLAIDITPPDTQYARDLMVSIRRKDITQMSFGFEIVDEDINHETNERTIKEVILWDVSPVTFPAYPQTDVYVRYQNIAGVTPEEVERRAQEIKNLIGGSKMASKIQEYHMLIGAAAQQMRSLLDNAVTEGRSLTEQEEAVYRKLENGVQSCQSMIEREIKVADLEKQQNTPINEPQVPFINRLPLGDKAEFKNFSEFLYTIASNPFDPRLRAHEQRLQQMGVGATGGFAIPEQFRPDLLSVSPQEAVIRPRAMVIAAGEPPDAIMRIPALDQGAASNMYGGVIVYHQGESVALIESAAALRQVALSPHKLTAYMTASNELLANWAASSPFLQTQMRRALFGAEDFDFFRGTGINQALGVINSGAVIAFNRAVALQIAYADVVGMLARIKYGGTLVWIASQTTIPQLTNIRDAGNNNLWVQSIQGPIPGSLAGIPLVYNERSPALGTRGDLVLADLGYYLIKDGSGPRLDISTDFRFTNDEVCFRIVWYVDGRPWLTEPLPLEGSVANTISPFVVLDVP